MSSEGRTIGIVGGGVSGLAAAEAVARLAADAGEPVRTIVFEAEAQLGGKVGSVREGGFVVETGPHGFLGREPKVFELIDRVGLRQQLLRADPSSRKRFMVRRERLQEVPMKPPAFLKSDLLSVLGRLRLVVEPFIPPEPPEEESVADFARRRIGDEAASVLVDAMVTGIYGGDPAELSLRSAFPRMHQLETEYGSLIRAQMALAAERRGEDPELKEARENLHSFRPGLQALVDALAPRASEIRTSAPVESISPGPDGYTLRGPFGQQTVDAVISTAPAPVLARMVGAAAPPLADAAGDVGFAPVVVVVLGFGAQDVAHPLDGFGYLAPGADRRDLLGAVWASSVFPEHAPAGTAFFRCMMGGARRPELVDASDEELVQRCRAELQQTVGLRAGAKLMLQRVIRWPEGIPQYNKGHRERVAAADGLEQVLPGLIVGGNSYRGVALIDCISGAEPLAHRALRALQGRVPHERLAASR